MNRSLCFLLISCVGINGCLSNSSYDERIRQSLADDAAERAARLREIDQREENAQQARIAYVQAHPKLPKEKKDALLSNKVMIGMTMEEVEIGWGKPQRINKSGGERWAHEQWVFPNAYLYFENGIMRSWQTSE